MLRDGDGIPQDSAEAVAWLRKSAEEGDGLAQYDLTEMYYRGAGVSQDRVEAVKWYRAAQLGGFDGAIFPLALIWYQTDAVPTSGVEAGECLHLGYMLLNGDRIAENKADALKWVRRAAEQGLPAAQNYLGFIYLEGVCGPRDHEQALLWFRKAAEQGFDAAKQMLAELESPSS